MDQDISEAVITIIVEDHTREEEANIDHQGHLVLQHSDQQLQHRIKKSPVILVERRDTSPGIARETSECLCDRTEWGHGQTRSKKPTETSVFIDSVETQALLDTGSCISSVGHSFYVNNLSHLPLLPITDLLSVECADGNRLPYLRYIKATLTSSGIPECSGQFCLFLIVPDTSYNLKVPVLIGTNLLDEFIKDCKSLHGDQYLQKANLMTPLYFSFEMFSYKRKGAEEK